MIKLFGQTDTNFSSNGDLTIIPLRAVVHKEDNGDFYLDLTTSLRYVDDLTEGRIIVAPTPQGEQTFRVGNVQKTKNKLYTKCWHTFYDTENYLIEDSRAVDKNLNDALDHFNSNTEPASPFTVLSDVSSIATLYIVRKSYYETIMECIQRWGSGHLVRDKFNIQIRESIGQDNGVTVRYGKNIKDITAEYNWDNVVTKLLPTGFDGIMLDEKYLTGDIQYDIPYTKTVQFDQNIDQEPYEDGEGNLDESAYEQALKDDLRIQATNYLNANNVPQVNYTLNANLEKITDIGDTVQVIDTRLNIDITTNVIAFEYDCILEKYSQIQFGNFKKTLSNLVSNIADSAQEAVNEAKTEIQVTLGQEMKQATDKIWAALGNSYVIYEGDKILVVDRLPKETATNVIMINNGGIAFSQTGINGTFNSAWTIDGTLNMQAINVINLTANLIKGGTLKLGSALNASGTIEVYNETNGLIAELNKNGLKMYGVDGSYVLMNTDVGFAGYDRNDNKIYWVSEDEFHMKKSVVEEEITLCNKLRFIPITIDIEGKNICNYAALVPYNTVEKVQIDDRDGFTVSGLPNNGTVAMFSDTTFTFEAGTYTISFDIRKANASDNLKYNSSGTAYIAGKVGELKLYSTGASFAGMTLTTSWQRVYFTVTFSQSTTFSSHLHVYFSPYTGTLEMSNIQIEEGSTATDYEPYTGGVATHYDGIGLVSVGGN